jgi:tripartite-type tricarboxylate transporter receptor subunit TctC
MTPLARKAAVPIVAAGVAPNRRESVMIRVIALAAVALASTQASAEPVADFYRGKTIQMVIGVSAGGDYDLRARLVAKHLAKYIPGNPTIVSQNMLGGGGLNAANWLAHVAPRDGTVLLAISSTLPVSQAVGLKGVQYDIRKFNYIGNTTDSPNVINSWHTTGITKIEQVMERGLVVGATGRSSGSYYYPAALNAWAGTKFKIVLGYPGGANVNIAMERGEVGGRGSNIWASWKSTRPQWLAENKIHILVQVGLKRNAELPDVPLMQELIKDDLNRQAAVFMSADSAIARAFVTTPDTPPDRLAALRRAFDAAMKDPALLAEAERAHQDISTATGEESQSIANSIVNTPAAVAARAKEILEGGN